MADDVLLLADHALLKVTWVEARTSTTVPGAVDVKCVYDMGNAHYYAWALERVGVSSVGP